VICRAVRWWLRVIERVLVPGFDTEYVHPLDEPVDR
jgi:hypothetical protein